MPDSILNKAKLPKDIENMVLEQFEILDPIIEQTYKKS
jgi:hypothetical protein